MKSFSILLLSFVLLGLAASYTPSCVSSSTGYMLWNAGYFLSSNCPSGASACLSPMGSDSICFDGHLFNSHNGKCLSYNIATHTLSWEYCSDSETQVWQDPKGYYGYFDLFTHNGLAISYTFDPFNVQEFPLNLVPIESNNPSQIWLTTYVQVGPYSTPAVPLVPGNAYCADSIVSLESATSPDSYVSAYNFMAFNVKLSNPLEETEYWYVRAAGTTAEPVYCFESASNAGTFLAAASSDCSEASDSDPCNLLQLSTEGCNLKSQWAILLQADGSYQLRSQFAPNRVAFVGEDLYLRTEASASIVDLTPNFWVNLKTAGPDC